MHASVRTKGAGACPICGMDLVPVKKSEQETGEVRIGAERRARKLGSNRSGGEGKPRRPGARSRSVTINERGVKDISLKVSGWVTKLHANALGDPVRKRRALA